MRFPALAGLMGSVLNRRLIKWHWKNCLGRDVDQAQDGDCVPHVTQVRGVSPPEWVAQAF